jgi:hypothetical protein
LVYLAVGNLLLRSDFAREVVNRRPERFHVGWRSAWTLFPGHLGATELRLGGHVRRILWTFEAERVSGRFSIVALLRRELRVPRAKAVGVVGAVRKVSENRAPPPPRPGGWTLRFERIELEDVREARAGALVLSGRGEGHVGFSKTLRGGPLEILPSEIGFEGATLSRTEGVLAQEARLRAAFSIAKHRREEAPGIRKLSKASVDLDVAATIAGIAIGSRDGRERTFWSIDDPGKLELKLGWRQGALAPRGNARVELLLSERLAATPRRVRASAAVEVRENGAHLDVLVEPTRESPSRAKVAASLDGREIPLPLDAAALLSRVSGDLSADWRLDTFAPLRALLPALHAFRFDGAGSLETQLALRKGQIQPGGSLRLELAKLRALRDASPVAENWWADASFGESRTGESPVAFDGRLAVRMKDASPLLAVYAERRHLPEWVGNVVGAGELDAQADLRVRRDELLVRSLEVRDDPFDVLARMRLHDERMTGDLYVGWHALGVGVQIDGDQREFHLRKAREWYESVAPSRDASRSH